MSTTLHHPPTGTAEEDPAVRETTVLIVDDHRSFADLLAASLSTVPDVRCVGTAASAAEGLRLVQELAPSVVVMDIQMPGTDGLIATRRLRQASPQTAVAVVTAHYDGEWVARAAAAGASAFIPKSGSLAEMVALLKAAKPGPMQVAPSVLATARLRDQRVAELGCTLTRRELEVLGFIGQGLQAKSIARVLGITPHTCRGHIKVLYAKLHVSSRIAAVNRGRELHLLRGLASGHQGAGVRTAGSEGRPQEVTSAGRGPSRRTARASPARSCGRSWPFPVVGGRPRRRRPGRCCPARGHR